MSQAQDEEMLRREVAELRARVDELAEMVRQLAGLAPPASEGAQEAADSEQQMALTKQANGFLLRSLSDRECAAAVFLAIAWRHEPGRPNTWAYSATSTFPVFAEPNARKIARVLSALGSDARLRLLEMLWTGERTASELAEAAGLGAGSLYHHIRELLALGWVESPERTRYAITPAGRKALVLAWALSAALSAA